MAMTKGQDERPRRPIPDGEAENTNLINRDDALDF